MSNAKITKQDYYRELHAAARNYNTKLWAIPPIFIAVAGFVINKLKLEDIKSAQGFASYENLILLLGGGAIALILLLQALKDSYFQILIQKKINEIEEQHNLGTQEGEAIPIFSATDTEILKGILWLRALKEEKSVNIPAWKELLIRRRVSNLFFLMVIAFLIGVTVGIIMWIVGFLMK